MRDIALTPFRRQYERCIAQGIIVPDTGHRSAVDALDKLSAALEHTHNSILGWFEGTSATEGVYLWGKVGRGKSMLMDLFFDCIAEKQKRRVHFHAFMADVHARMGEHGEGGAETNSSGGSIVSAADSFARDTRLLCLDELEVTDIADAMILGRLFDNLFDRGMVLVATSNEPPDNLYGNGANRDLFVPFIERLKRHVDVVEITSDHDYRTGRGDEVTTYLCPFNQLNQERFDRLWHKTLRGASEQTTEVKIHGRGVSYPRTWKNFLRVTFDEVCVRALSADDHLALADRFSTVFLESVPTIGNEREDAARRLVTLIDALYEAKARLIVLADAEPDNLFEDRNSDDHRRTSSRLEEMRSVHWATDAQKDTKHATDLRRPLPVGSNGAPKPCG